VKVDEGIVVVEEELLFVFENKFMFVHLRIVVVVQYCCCIIIVDLLHHIAVVAFHHYT